MVRASTNHLISMSTQKSHAPSRQRIACNHFTSMQPSCKSVSHLPTLNRAAAQRGASQAIPIAIGSPEGLCWPCPDSYRDFWSFLYQDKKDKTLISRLSPQVKCQQKSLHTNGHAARQKCTSQALLATPSQTPNIAWLNSIHGVPAPSALHTHSPTY